jgi:hypothetical protein
MNLEWKQSYWDKKNALQKNYKVVIITRFLLYQIIIPKFYNQCSIKTID